MTTPATEADNNPLKQFQDNIAAQIREKIGGLMPDEMIKKIVEEGVHNELYKPTHTGQSTGYGSRPELKPFIQVAIEEHTMPILRGMINDVLDSNKPVLEKIIQDFVRDSLPALLTGLIQELLQSNIQKNIHRYESILAQKLGIRPY